MNYIPCRRAALIKNKNYSLDSVASVIKNENSSFDAKIKNLILRGFTFNLTN